MKSIKKLLVSTNEKITVKDVETFYSEEWGEDGGIHCSVVYDGKVIADLYNAGEGGCASLNFGRDISEETISKFKDAAKKYLNRREKAYAKNIGGPLVNVSDDAIEELCNSLIAYNDVAKFFQRTLKKTPNQKAWVLFADFSMVYGCVASTVPDDALTELIRKTHSKKHSKIDKIEIFHNLEEMETL